jgi:hypothetical protein
VPYQTSLICHSSAILECVARFGATADLRLPSYVLRVRARNRYYDLFPQFIERKDGRLLFSRHMPAGRDGAGFVGWLPYAGKRWPASTSKLAFKEFCAAHGLRTPRISLGAPEGFERYIVKGNASSFGQGIRGPFRKQDAGDPGALAGEKEYCEEFIAGRSAKAWYWDDKLAALEILTMPTVTGDGARTYRNLMAAMPRPMIEALARFQGIEADAMVPAGKTLMADFRHGSPFLTVNMLNQNVLAEHAASEIGRQFAATGATFWSAVPEEQRPLTVYTVDAIVDDKDRVWFVEMNCNPAVHPDVYPAMFGRLFGPEDENQPAQQMAPLPDSPPLWGVVPPNTWPPGAVAPAPPRHMPPPVPGPLAN